MTAGPGGEMAAGSARPGHLRASHADREQVVDVLKTAYVQGRLAKGEFDARIGQAFASRTYADLAAVTADLPAWLAAAEPLRKPGLKAQPPGSSEIKPAVVAVITGMTALTAGLWAVVLTDHTITDNGPQWMLGFLLVLTFTNIGMLILTGVVVREARHRNRSGRQLPPSRPGAGGQVSPRHVSGASAERLPKVNPAAEHSDEAQRSRSRGRNRSAGDYRILGPASAAL